ncbi:MAG TPA: hypothetical protein VFS42_01415, partial [Burkholderiaceae bacterium]|nr:hypothetical protein [Burkholderiaceae bacterium]
MTNDCSTWKARWKTHQPIPVAIARLNLQYHSFITLTAPCRSSKLLIVFVATRFEQVESIVDTQGELA